MLRVLSIAASLLIFTPAYADLAGDMLAKIGQGMPKGCPYRLWCACGLNRVLVAAGYKSTGSNRASDAVSYGVSAKKITRNTIVVFKNHIGVATGKTCNDGRLEILSANHSNKYGVGCYSSKRVIAARKAVRR